MLILLILVILLLGGGGFYGWRRYPGDLMWPGLATLLIVLLIVLYLFSPGPIVVR